MAASRGNLRHPGMGTPRIQVNSSSLGTIYGMNEVQSIVCPSQSENTLWVSSDHYMHSLPVEEGECSTGDHTAQIKKRNLKFNDQENHVLVSGVLQHYDRIFGNLSGTT
ncbi:hypothetical protein FKM82_021920 [Ascaphus truei]